MPELPEVETIRSYLAQNILHTTICKIRKGKLSTRLRVPLSPLTDRIIEASIRAVDRRGKYLLLHLDNKFCITLHLGMSGRVFLINPLPALETKPHYHIALMLDSKKWLIYEDPRRFGSFLVHACHDLPKNLQQLGKEPFDITVPELITQLHNRTAPIKNILLQQHIIAGLGNIYVSEALWLAKIHPLEKGCMLSSKLVANLLEAIRTVLKKAIKAGGSTLRDYRQANGDMGYFQYHFKAYGAENQKCELCGALIEKMTIGNRSSYFCPAHQILQSERKSKGTHRILQK